ncbi:formate dehydrogenase [Massilia forsythiae]|uniref:Formate dehydrogenase n=1 Tax=Massilia forsythiae TaxID=2728020 RepID=A0A7Z2ZTI9_9BURK|nr:NAD(P)H-dependent oxidoreductase subunit E [Massilia forsythiae]QJE00057.1 formate dehydrogenase [Massilia forsythiae]
MQAPLSPAAADTVAAAVLARHDGRQDQLLPALHALQDAIGFIAPARVPAIARHFNLSRAEVHGVLTFYHHFRAEAPARCRVTLCRAEACRSMGADRLLAHAQRTLGCDLHGRSADGSVSLDPVYCLGQCANAPAMTLDDAVFARVTPARFDALLAHALEADRPAPTHPGGPSFLPEAV